MATYKKNYLTSVILKIDFDPAELGKLKEFADKIKADFPIAQVQSGKEGMLDFDFVTQEVKKNITPITSWTFFNNERSKKITIHPRYFVIDYSVYRNSEELIADIKTLSLFITDFGIKTINRAGLRYINEIKLSDSNFLDWENYFNSDLLGQLKFVKDNSKTISRSMGNVVFKETFGDIGFNYGLWNTNYPNEINEKNFILDFDAYSKFPIDTEGLNLENLIKEYNEKIESIFESVIKDGYRDLLNS